MNSLLCRWFGHRWIKGRTSAPRYYVCRRCGEPGFWVADSE